MYAKKMHKNRSKKNYVRWAYISKTKHSKNRKIIFADVSKHCSSFRAKNGLFCFINFLSILNTKSIISQKLKIAKIKKMFFRTFHSIAQHFGTKTQSGHF